MDSPPIVSRPFQKPMSDLKARPLKMTCRSCMMYVCMCVQLYVCACKWMSDLKARPLKMTCRS